MNHNAFNPQQLPPVEAPQHEARVLTEEQARERLISEVVQSTEVGSVTFYSSQFANLHPKELTTMRDTIVQRQHAPSAKEASLGKGLQAIGTVSAGWANYGEREILGRDDTVGKLVPKPGQALPALRDKNKPGSQGAENLLFVELPDGRIDVRYSFRPQDGYSDSTRRNSSLDAGFILPPKEAMRLLDATERDPSVIEDVLKAQAMALGVSENRWTMRDILPRIKNSGETFHRTRAQRELGISAYGVDGYDSSGQPNYRQMGEEVVVPGDRHDSLIPVANHEPPEWSEANMSDFDKMLAKLPQEYEAFDDPADALEDFNQRIVEWEHAVEDGLLDHGHLTLALKASQPIIDNLLLKLIKEFNVDWDAKPAAEKQAFYEQQSRAFQEQAGTLLREKKETPESSASYIMPLMYADAYTRFAQAEAEKIATQKV